MEAMPENGLDYLNQKCRNPKCESTELVYIPEKGETVCKECGEVLNEKEVWDLRKSIKSQIYKNFYGPMQYPSIPAAYRGSSIGFSEDANRNKLSPKTKAHFKRLRKIHRSHSQAKDRAFLIFNNILDLVGPLWNVKRDTERIFIKAQEKKLTSGRSYEGIIGAAIWIAYKMNKYNYPKKVKELIEEISISLREIYRCCRVLVQGLDLKINIVFKPEDFIPEICADVEADIKIQTKAIEVAKAFRKRKNISGKNPVGIAIAALYLVSEKYHKIDPGKYKKITQKEFASAGGVTEITLRTRKKEIEETLKI